MRTNFLQNPKAEIPGKLSWNAPRIRINNKPIQTLKIAVNSWVYMKIRKVITGINQAG